MKESIPVEMVSDLVSAVLQLIVFALVPLIVYLIRHRRLAGFGRSVGLHRTSGAAVAYSLLLSLIILVLTFGMFILLGLADALLDPSSAAAQIKAMELPVAAAVLVILIRAFIQTSLAEEILFRGFIGKGLIRKFGFAVGNTVQAVFFGLIHGGLFIGLGGMGAGPAAAVIAATSTAGFLLGYIKEKLGGGSIIPGWIAHGTSNAIAFSLTVFWL